MINKEWAEDLSENWNKIAPITFGYARNDTVSELLRSFYLGSLDKPITNDSFEALGAVSFAFFVFGAFKSESFS